MDQIKEELQKTDEKHIYIFKNCEVILIHLKSLVDEDIVTFKDLVNLFRYAIKEMGISGNIITKIVMKFIIMKKDNKNMQA